jgi:pyruvate dehydrogenase E1 component beta subunit
MAEDDSVVVIGEEVGLYGGAYGVTKDLIGRFGAGRLIDTPISEAGIVGAAVGAAMTGLRPVAELMYVDFLGLAMDQLANQAAKARYMFGGQIGVPMVLRTQGGTGRSAGRQHSQSLEAWVMHTPGLRLAMPATAADAYHLLRHSLTLPDPSCSSSTRPSTPGRRPPTWRRPPHPGARPSSAARAATWRSWPTRAWSTPRWKRPPRWRARDRGRPWSTCARSTRSTWSPSPTRWSAPAAPSVLSEAPMTAGVAAELAARIGEECFDFLEDPVLRIAGEDVPIPVSPALEAACVPDAALVVESVERMLRW